MQVASESTKTIRSLPQIRALVSQDMQSIEALMHEELHSSVPLTREIIQHIFQSRGKQLRPLVMTLTAQAFCNNTRNKALHALAVIIEFVHTATLLHDDVVDYSDLRRGKRTANNIWGNAASVLVGDFLYSRAFQILSRHPNTRILSLLSHTTNAIAEGEVQQLMNRDDINLSEENYFRVITQKTARLFSAAAEIGAILAGANDKQAMAMADYGLHFGIAFQIVDDLLDYTASAQQIGKNTGDDFREGKITLPIIYALEAASPSDADRLRKALQQPERDNTELTTVLDILKTTHALQLARVKAQTHVELARTAILAHTPPSPYRDGLLDLLFFALNRTN